MNNLEQYLLLNPLNNSNVQTASEPRNVTQAPVSVLSVTSTVHPNILSTKSDLKISESDNLGEASSNRPNMKELLSPLYKYLKGNSCLLCGFKSKSKEPGRVVRKHLVTHLTTRNFKCDICVQSFTSPENLILHRQTHSDKFSFSCNVCNKKFHVRRNLTNHMRRCHRGNTEKYRCAICSKEYKKIERLREHHRVHTDEQPYMCSTCNKTFRTRDLFMYHSYLHNAKKRFMCTICGKGYNQKIVLTDHMLSHSDKPAPHKCDICGKTFNFRSNLCQHKIMHSEVRAHSCDICGKTFKLPHHLRSHVLTHNPS